MVYEVTVIVDVWGLVEHDASEELLGREVIVGFGAVPKLEKAEVLDTVGYGEVVGIKEEHIGSISHNEIG